MAEKTLLDHVADFKKQIYIQWYPEDWLNDSNVRLLKPDVKGFWIDLISQMHFFYPYGHCAKFSFQKLKKIQKLDSLKKFSLESLVNQKSNREDNLTLVLSVLASVDDQLKVAVSLEDELNKFLPYQPDEIKHYIKVLEEENIFSRTSTGIIYSRRMHKDFRKRVTAFLNGKQGGNPGLKAGRNGNRSKNGPEHLVGGLVNQISNHGDGFRVDSLDKATVPYNYNLLNNTGEGGLRGETILGKRKESYQVQDILLKSWDELKHYESIMGKISEKDFGEWKRFIQMIYDHGYRDIFIGSMVNPEDFTTLRKKHQYTEVRWMPVIKAILGTGVKPEHKMFYRIQDYIGYLFKNGQNGQKGNVDTGGENYEGQESWSNS